MKKLVLVFGVCLMFNNTIEGQIVENVAPSDRPNHLSVGYNVNDYGHDFGVGLNITSPYFAFKTLALRASTNYQRFNYIDTTGKYNWMAYQNIKIGILSSAFIANRAIRVYGEGGVAILMCPPEMTSVHTSIAGYGLFGFEFFISKGFSYFIELGAIGTKTTAEVLPTKPYFSNGFTSSIGLRLYLKGQQAPQ